MKENDTNIDQNNIENSENNAIDNSDTNTENTNKTTDSNVTEEDETCNESENKIKELEDKNAELNDRYIRLAAEFENFKKRTRQERLDIIETASSDLIKSLLPVIDDMERGIESNKKNDNIKSISEGFELIYNKYINILKQRGLESMDSVGKDFDTDFHEALTIVENKEMKDKVVEEIEKGYMLKGKVIRFAKVIVGK